MATILDGKIIRDQIAHDLRKKIEKAPIKPTLVILQVGDRPDSEAYIRQKKLFAEKIGASVIHTVFPGTISQTEILTKIQEYNTNKEVHGILLQIPLPLHLDKYTLIEAIDSVKDVDGLSSKNTQFLWEGKLGGHMPATSRGILKLCDYYKIHLEGKNCVVIGKSTLVGKPTAVALLNRGATVVVCHKQTDDIAHYTKHADIIVVAAGSVGLITKNHVNNHQIIIDVGINEYLDPSDSNRKLTGDVDFKNVEPFVKAITPVPGGVGPMTVASLFENLYDAYIRLTL